MPVVGSGLPPVTSPDLLRSSSLAPRQQPPLKGSCYFEQWCLDMVRGLVSKRSEVTYQAFGGTADAVESPTPAGDYKAVKDTMAGAFDYAAQARLQTYVVTCFSKCDVFGAVTRAMEKDKTLRLIASKVGADTLFFQFGMHNDDSSNFFSLMAMKIHVTNDNAVHVGDLIQIGEWIHNIPDWKRRREDRDHLAGVKKREGKKHKP